MHTAEIVIYVIVGILGSLLFVALAVHNIRNCRKQEYVESIKIGDTFAHNRFKLYDTDDPFSENYGGLEFNTEYYATIIDIKKNSKGETWVKYCFTKNINNPNHGTWTEEINNFLRCRTRISRRIDNINTNE